MLRMRACWIAAVAFSASCAEDKAPLSAPELTGQLPKVVNESSGLVRSRKYPDKDVFWTHNDSGDPARIFAVESKGALLREVQIPNGKNVDWEDIAFDDGGRLVIADIGDNPRRRKSLTLYRLPEPDAFNPAEIAADAQVFHFRYPDGEGPFDAEALFVRGKFAYVLTKDQKSTRCYRLPLPEKPPQDGKPVVAEFIGATEKIATVTGADLSPDGRHLALVTYLAVRVTDLQEPFGSGDAKAAAAGLFDKPSRTRIGFLGQTEAVAWDGDDLVLTTEAGAIYRIRKAKSHVATGEQPAGR
jgi:hypothetical protein